MVASLKRNCVIFSLASLLLCGFEGAASSQTIAPPGGGTTALPAIEVAAPHRAQPPRRPRAPVITRARRREPDARPPTEAQVLASKTATLDDARRNIFAPVGTGRYEFSHQAIEALPQGTNSALDKVLLQAPGVTQDTAERDKLHVRNEHGNLQFRINGIALPEGAGAFGQFLDTAIVGQLDLITGALPAQFGLRTAVSWISRRKPTHSTTAAASASMEAATERSRQVTSTAARLDKHNTSYRAAISGVIWD
jgi:hypothetical protein